MEIQSEAKDGKKKHFHNKPVNKYSHKYYLFCQHGRIQCT